MVANNNNSNQLTKFTNKSIIFSPIYWYGLFVRGVLLFFLFERHGQNQGRRRREARRQVTASDERRGGSRGQWERDGEQQGVAGIDPRGGSG